MDSSPSNSSRDEMDNNNTTQGGDWHLGSQYCFPFASSPPHSSNDDDGSSNDNDNEEWHSANEEETSSNEYHSCDEDNTEEPTTKRSRREHEDRHLGHRYAFPFLSSPPSSAVRPTRRAGSEPTDARTENDDHPSPLAHRSNKKAKDANANGHPWFPALCSPPSSPDSDSGRHTRADADESPTLPPCTPTRTTATHHPLFSLCSPPSSSSSSSQHQGSRRMEEDPIPKQDDNDNDDGSMMDHTNATTTNISRIDEQSTSANHPLFSLCSPPSSSHSRQDSSSSTTMEEDDHRDQQGDDDDDEATIHEHPLFSLCSPPSHSQDRRSMKDDQESQDEDDDATINEHPLFPLCSPPSSSSSHSQGSRSMQDDQDSQNEDDEATSNEHPLFPLCSPPSSQDNGKLSQKNEEDNAQNEPRRHHTPRTLQQKASTPPPTTTKKQTTAVQLRNSKDDNNNVNDSPPGGPTANTNDKGSVDDGDDDDEDIVSTKFDHPPSVESHTSFHATTKQGSRRLSSTTYPETAQRKTSKMTAQKSPSSSVSSSSSESSAFPFPSPKLAAGKQGKGAAPAAWATKKARATNPNQSRKPSASLSTTTSGAQNLPVSPSRHRRAPADSNGTNHIRSHTSSISSNPKEASVHQKSTPAMKSITKSGRKPSAESPRQRIHHKRKTTTAPTKTVATVDVAKPALEDNDDRGLLAHDEPEGNFKSPSSNGSFPLAHLDDSEDDEDDVDDFPMPESKSKKTGLKENRERPMELLGGFCRLDSDSDDDDSAFPLPEPKKPRVAAGGTKQSNTRDVKKGKRKSNVSSQPMSEPKTDDDDDDFPIYISTTRRRRPLENIDDYNLSSSEDDDDECFPMPKRKRKPVESVRQPRERGSTMPTKAGDAEGKQAIACALGTNRKESSTPVSEPKHTKSLLLEEYPEYLDIAIKLNHPKIIPRPNKAPRRSSSGRQI